MTVHPLRHEFRESAVLVPLVFQQNEPHLLLTERSHTVEHHKGQICFPGGARDATDSNLYQTALRESAEEIGLGPEHVFLLGNLPMEATPTLYTIQPFVAVITETGFHNLNYNNDEIASVFLTPLSHFANPDVLRMEQKDYFGHTLQIPYFQHPQHVIWGATGRIILNLLKMMHISKHHQNLDANPTFLDLFF